MDADTLLQTFSKRLGPAWKWEAAGEKHPPENRARARQPQGCLRRGGVFFSFQDL
jgi:hypothetical protein